MRVAYRRQTTTFAQADGLWAMGVYMVSKHMSSPADAFSQGVLVHMGRNDGSPDWRKSKRIVLHPL